MELLDEFILFLKNTFGNGIISFYKGIIVIFIGYFLLKIISHIIKKLILRLPINNTTAKFSSSLANSILYFLYLLLVLASFGFNINGILTLFGGFSVAIGLAVKDILSNLFNGLSILVTKRFKVGDYVLINNVEGVVEAIYMSHTVLKTIDNKIITIPNNNVTSNNIINYSKLPTSRVNLLFSIPYNYDVDKAKEVIINCAKKSPYVICNLDVLCEIDKFNTSSIDLSLICYIDSKNFRKVKYNINKIVYSEFKNNNIDFAFNVLDVRMVN